MCRRTWDSFASGVTPVSACSERVAFPRVLSPSVTPADVYSRTSPYNYSPPVDRAHGCAPCACLFIGDVVMTSPRLLRPSAMALSGVATPCLLFALDCRGWDSGSHNWFSCDCSSPAEVHNPIHGAAPAFYTRTKIVAGPGAMGLPSQQPKNKDMILT